MYGNISTELKQLLQLKDKIPFFSGMSDEEVMDLVDDVKILQYSQGDIIIQEGSKYGKYLYVLLQGGVEVKKITSTSDKKLANMKDNGTFGEISALTNFARSATIVSSESGTMIVAFSIKYEEDSGRALFYKNVINELSNKIITINGGSTEETSLWDLW